MAKFVVVLVDYKNEDMDVIGVDAVSYAEAMGKGIQNSKFEIKDVSDIVSVLAKFETSHSVTDVDYALRTLVECGKKIVAIKLYRALYGGNLRVSKDYVEAL